MNELEQLVAFLPRDVDVRWFGNPRYAAIACAVYIVGRDHLRGRLLGATRQAQSRASGIPSRLAALVVTWVAALVSVVRVARIRLATDGRKSGPSAIA